MVDEEERARRPSRRDVGDLERRDEAREEQCDDRDRVPRAQEARARVDRRATTAAKSGAHRENLVLEVDLQFLSFLSARGPAGAKAQEIVGGRG